MIKFRKKKTHSGYKSSTNHHWSVTIHLYPQILMVRIPARPQHHRHHHHHHHHHQPAERLKHLHRIHQIWPTGSCVLACCEAHPAVAKQRWGKSKTGPGNAWNLSENRNVNCDKDQEMIIIMMRTSHEMIRKLLELIMKNDDPNMELSINWDTPK